MRMMKLVLLTVSLCFQLGNVSAQQKQKATTAGVKATLNKPAPAFTLRNSDSSLVSLADFKGKLVLVDFWASWCMPCRAFIPHLKELYAKYQSSGFEIISVSIDAKQAAWKKALLKEQMPWPQLIDEFAVNQSGSSKVAGMYGALSVPYTVVIDGTGKVIAINPTHEGIDSLLLKVYGH